MSVPRRRGVLAALLTLAGVTLAASASEAVSATRVANTTPVRALFDLGAVTVTPGAEAWKPTGADNLPFDYEQGVEWAGPNRLVFNSRGMLHRTTEGCPRPGDDASPCYDVVADNRTPINAAEAQAGFNHIGDTGTASTGAAKGYLFTPLEKSPGNGVDRIFKVFDVETLQPAGRLEVKGPFRHHSWVMVDPSGTWMISADASIRSLELYRIAQKPTALPAERIALTRQKSLDIAVGGDIPADVGPTGCAFRDPKTIYCVDWVKDEPAKRDVRTDVYRIDLRHPAGTRGSTATSVKAFSLTFAHTHPGITYGYEGEGITFFRRSPRGPLELHLLVRGERLLTTALLHLSPR